MRRNTIFISTGTALAVLVGLALVFAVPAGSADDESAAVKARFAEFVAAWGKHDPKGMASIWAEDGDLINPWGRLATGRAQVETLFVDEQTGKGPLRESTFKVNGESVRFPTSDVAVSDVEITISGALAPDGTKAKAMEMHVTVIWKKADGSWSMFATRPYLKAAEPAAK